MAVKKTKTRATTTRSDDTKKVPVSEGNIRKAAQRLLQQNLVSTEIQYVQRVLGASATQQDIDKNVIAVRGMVWASIAPLE
jgi:hypothetical protein